jgi:DNA-binding transcriptional MerR regulator
MLPDILTLFCVDFPRLFSISIYSYNCDLLSFVWICLSTWGLGLDIILGYRVYDDAIKFRKEKTMLQVSEVSRKLGVNPQTLYFYERIGLIPSPNRTESGYRLYADKDLERLTFISRAKALGLTLEEIGEILALKDNAGMECCFVVRDRLQAKVDQIQQTIQQLQDLRDDLLPMIEQCDRGIATEKEDCSTCWLDP